MPPFDPDMEEGDDCIWLNAQYMDGGDGGGGGGVDGRMVFRRVAVKADDDDDPAAGGCVFEATRPGEVGSATMAGSYEVTCMYEERRPGLRAAMSVGGAAGAGASAPASPSQP